MELTSGTNPGTRRHLARFEWGLLAVALAIAGLGVWNLESAARNGHGPLWTSQLLWLVAGLVCLLAICLWDYRHLLTFSYPLYAVVVVLLLVVITRGKVVLGARRWLDFGPVRLQPSELAKLTVALALARYFHDRLPPKGGYRLRDLLVPFALILVPVALVMKQPDLGTALIIASVGMSICLFAGVRLDALAVLMVGGAAGSWVVWTRLLHGYQKRRLLSFLNPEGDALGAGYHANQSMIAVGSGQLSGKGFGQGTQTQLSFLPEQHTDFIFSVWAEEHGFYMCLLLLGLYLLLFIWALSVAGRARERFGTFVAFGIAAMIFWQVFINIGMVTGLLPVVGVTLPLMSYGGSSLLTVLLGLGLLLDIGMRRSGY
jgi:rod shape determining protein RodA